MELKAVEAVFLVTRETWYGGLESFLEQHRRPDGNLNLEPVRKHFDQRSDSILVDRNYTQHAFVAELMLSPQPMTDANSRIKAIATMIAWLAGSFILHVRIATSGSPLTIDGTVGSKETASTLRDEFVKSLQKAATPPPVPLCRWVFIRDESLNSISTQDELAPWIETHDTRKFGDLYASFRTYTTILHIIETPPIVTFRWYIAQADSESHPYLLNEIRAADIYLATDVLFDEMKADVEAQIVKAREAVERENDNPAAPGWLGLIASLNPQHEDDLRTTAGRISELNHSVLNIQNSIARLESLYSIYHEDWPWRHDSLKLARVGYVRGRLVSTEQDEAGQLTLAEYYRRSGLRIEEFYRHKFDHALQGLHEQLDYLRTVAALRTEQQAAVLNRLVLLLTFVTIILAVLQIFSALPAFQDYKLLIIAGVLIGIVIIGVVLAGRRSSPRRRRRT